MRDGPTSSPTSPSGGPRLRRTGLPPRGYAPDRGSLARIREGATHGRTLRPASPLRQPRCTATRLSGSRADREIVEALVLVVQPEMVMGGVVRVGVGHAAEGLDGGVDVAEALVQRADVLEGDHVPGVRRAARSRACTARSAPGASATGAACDRGPTSAISHPRATPGRARADSCTGRRHRAPCRRTADRRTA